MASLTLNTSIQQLVDYLASGSIGGNITIANNAKLANDSPGSLIGNALDLLSMSPDMYDSGVLSVDGTSYVQTRSAANTSAPAIIATVTGSGFSLSTDPTRASSGLINESDVDFTINSFNVELLETQSSTTSLASFGFTGSLVVSNDVLTSGSLTSFSMTAINGASLTITGALNYNGVNLTSTAATLTWSMDTNPAEETISLATLQVKVANLVFNNTTDTGIITEIKFDDVYLNKHFALTGTSINFADLVGTSRYDLENLINLAGTGASDTVRASSDFVLPAAFENLVLTGTTAINGTGNSLGNTLTGNSVANILSGLAGADTLNGAGGNDTLNGGAGADIMKGGIGNDTYIVDNVGDTVTELASQGIDLVKSSITYTLTPNVEKLTLTGTAAINGTGNGMNNTLLGNAYANKLIGLGGADTLNGNGGKDILIGGGGNDTLIGGLGNDFFVFNTALNASTNIDTIKDYTVAQDTIRLENSIFTQLTATGVLNADYFKVGATAEDANDFIVYNASTGALYYDADGSGAGAAIQFATVYATGTTPATLNAAEFVVI